MLRLARPYLLRRLVALLLVASTGLAIATPVASQSWPGRPLTIVVPYAPGGWRFNRLGGAPHCSGPWRGSWPACSYCEHGRRRAPTNFATHPS